MGARCPICRQQYIFGNTNVGHEYTLDHILPKEWGGTGTKDNLRPMCQECNRLRANAWHCIGILACAEAVAQSRGYNGRKGICDLLNSWRHAYDNDILISSITIGNSKKVKHVTRWWKFGIDLSMPGTFRHPYPVD